MKAETASHHCLAYQNRRGDYVESFLDHLVNWRFLSQNIE